MNDTRAMRAKAFFLNATEERNRRVPQVDRPALQAMVTWFRYWLPCETTLTLTCCLAAYDAQQAWLARPWYVRAWNWVRRK